MDDGLGWGFHDDVGRNRRALSAKAVREVKQREINRPEMWLGHSAEGTARAQIIARARPRVGA